MRYTFTSFSAPDSTLTELFALAGEHGYNGVELRIGLGHAHAVEPETSGLERAAVRSQIIASGMTVPCLSTSARLAWSGPHEEQARAAVDLASDLGVGFVRVFAGEIADQVSRHDARSRLVDALGRTAQYARGRDVVVLLETHDDWAKPSELVDIMEEVGESSAGILWDVWHTSRTGLSSVVDAHRVLRPWIRHVHVHDGLLRQDRLAWRSIGEGEVDHLAVLACLMGSGYQGVVSGEWIDGEPPSRQLPRELTALRKYEELLLTLRSPAADESENDGL